MYDMIRDNCGPQERPTFRVTANFQRAKPHMLRSYVKELTVAFYSKFAPIVSSHLIALSFYVDSMSILRIYRIAINNIPTYPPLINRYL